MATTSLQRRVRLGGRLRPGRGLRARSRLRVGPHALAKGKLEGLPYVAILLLLQLLLLVLFLILLFIFLLCASRLSTRQSKVDGTLPCPPPFLHRLRNFPRPITDRQLGLGCGFQRLLVAHAVPMLFVLMRDDRVQPVTQA